MSFIEDYVMKIVRNRVLVKVVAWLDGKKTAIGAINLLLWVAIYAIPAFTPNYNWIVDYAMWLRDALKGAGIDIDNELFNAGVGFTVAGLLDKIRKLFKRK